MDLSFGSPKMVTIQDEMNSMRQFEQNMFGFKIEQNNNGDEQNNNGNMSD